MATKKDSKKKASNAKQTKSAAKTLGKRHVCYKCGTKFYDLGKPEAICPRCGANQKDAPKQERPKNAKQKKPVMKQPKPKTPPEDLVEAIDENEVYIEDAFGYDITVQDDEGFDEFEE